MNENMKLWESVKLPPKDACKQITGGRMNGKTDINPMWRIQALTENFGVCGIGWYYDIKRLWTEDAADGQKLSFAHIELYVKVNGEWSKGITGIGGNTMIVKEKTGLFSSDECYKMAITDAISVSCKMLGFGAVVYSGMKSFETKYDNTPVQSNESKPNPIQINNDVKKLKLNELINLATPIKNSIPEQLKIRLQELIHEEGKGLTADEYEAIKKDVLIMLADNKLNEVV